MDAGDVHFQRNATRPAVGECCTVTRTLRIAARCVPALGVGSALAALAFFSRNPDAEATYLAIPAVAVLVAVAWLAPGRSGVLPTEASWGALLVTLTAWTLPPGPVRGATVMIILATTLATATTRRVVEPESRPPALWFPLVFGLQVLLRSGRLFEMDWSVRHLGTFIGLPMLAALALLWLERRLGLWAALCLGALAVLPFAGFSVLGTLGLVVVAGVATWIRPRETPIPVGVPAVLGMCLFVVTLAASYPWLRPAPLASLTSGVLDVLQSPGAPVAATDGAPVVLSPATPVFALDGFDASISRVILDTHLTDSAALPPGTPVATVRLKTEVGHVRETWVLAAGVDTGEWAADRPDVASTPGFAAPSPWLSWIPPEGGFFAHRYRHRRDLEVPVEATSVSVVRRPDLPPGVRLVVTSAVVR